MRYMMMIKATKDYEEGRPPSPELMAGMAKLTEEMVKAGKLLAADGAATERQGHPPLLLRRQAHRDRRTLR
jgi:hypothetical protein